MRLNLHFMAAAGLAAQCLIFSSLAFAQDAAPAGRGAARGGRGNAAPQLPSYEVHPDRTVLFRLRAPDAASVKLNGDFLQAPPAVEGGPPPSAAKDLTKGDDGVWTVTVGPLHPAVYNYTFTVNGVHDIDPNNPMVKRGDRSSESMFEVPGDKSAVYDIQQ